jgi:hypothetical protein
VSQVYAKYQQAGIRIAENVITLIIVLEDKLVDDEEWPLVQAALDDLAVQGLVIEDAGYDVEQAIQTLRLGRQNAPDKRNLAPKIANFEAHRKRIEQQKAAARGELAAAAGQ